MGWDIITALEAKLRFPWMFCWNSTLLKRPNLTLSDTYSLRNLLTGDRLFELLGYFSLLSGNNATSDMETEMRSQQIGKARCRLLRIHQEHGALKNPWWRAGQIFLERRPSGFRVRRGPTQRNECRSENCALVHEELELGKG